MSEFKLKKSFDCLLADQILTMLSLKCLKNKNV